MPFALAAIAAAVVAPFAVGATERLAGLGLGFGFGFGGELRSMRGTPVPTVRVIAVVVVESSRDCRLFANLRCVGVLSFREELFKGEKGPSSTTQSLRSMREDFLPRFGGDGDGDDLGSATMG